MNTIREILPLILEPEHTEFIKKNFIFLGYNPENIKEINIVKSIDTELFCCIKQLQNIDLYNTSKDKIILMKNLIYNFFLVNNLDYNDDEHSIRGFEKYLNFINSTEKSVDNKNIVIVFKNIKSPLLNLSTGKIVIVKSNYFISKIISIKCDYFINYYAYVTCNSSKIMKNNLCSCVGKDNCRQNHFLISDPILDLSLSEMLKMSDIIKNIKTIFIQIIYMLKILQLKLGYIHQNLNSKNVFIKKYDEMFDLSFEHGLFIKKIKTNFIIKIGELHTNKFDISNDIFDGEEKLILNKYSENSNLSDDNSMNDIKNLYCSIDKGLLDGQFVINVDRLLQFNNINTVIDNLNILDSVTIAKSIGGNINLKGGNPEILIYDMKKCLDEFKITDIVKISIPSNSIYVDGYDENKFNFMYTDTDGIIKNYDFNYKNLLTVHEFYNQYGDFKEIKCITSPNSTITKKIIYGNPGYTKFFQYNNPIYYNNVYLHELEHPTKKNTSISYTYAFVINKYDDKVNVRFGKIINLLEIGCKHSIISYGDKLIISGELQIKKDDDGYTYYINFNSSKMHPDYTNLPHRIKGSGSFLIFYYIYVINLALKLFKTTNPKLNIKLPNNTTIKYGMKLMPLTYMKDMCGDDIVEYYSNPVCPSQDFFDKYNRFGEQNKIINACAGYWGDGNVIQVNGVKTCKWNLNIPTTNYYNKYIKYKNKYLELKKSSDKV